MVRQGNSRGSARKPVSPVYRRRRLFAGAVLLLVIALAVGGFVAISNALGGPAAEPANSSAQAGQPGGTPAPASASTATDPAASASAAPSPTSGCDDKLLTVTASTDKAAYGPGENPLLTLKVTNGNQVPCEVNIGTSQMEYAITSGTDRIFSSKDCQAESGDLVKTIAPGKSETANFPWDRSRSTEGCKAVAAQPGAGGAYYVFTARLGNKTSPKAVFQLG
ncbi:MAG TPA: hypothetical protein VFN00_02350 [Arthrobacter sp.]|nr:hypothetical protein [Arthrobacter sp.]